MNRTILNFSTLLLVLSTLSACSSVSTNQVASTPISVSLSTPPPSSLVVGKTAPVAATVANDTANAGVVWSCVPATSCGSFSPAQTASGATAVYTAPSSVPASDSVTITATSVADSTKSASATVAVNGLPAAVSVSISTAPPSSMAANGTASIAAKVTNDSANAGVTWSCAPAGTCGSFNPAQTASAAASVYTAPATAPVGDSVTITATSVTDNTKSASAVINIGSLFVALTPPPPSSMGPGATANPVATVSYDPANAGANWSCTPVGACGSFNPALTASGAATTYTAPATAPTGGSVTLTATSVTNSGQSASATVQIAPPVIAIDGASSGSTFNGFGGLSGGGGTSRLLFDYPPQQQSEVLDYLFKPNYGASLQIFKVEIGGDGNTTNGAEASHMRSATDLNYTRGYEWWLMEQAKQRNPNIKLYGLEWCAPGWFNNSAGGPESFFSNDNINYILNWINGAQSAHNLKIDYIGGWNEYWNWEPYDSWFVNLKSAMQGAGLKTQLVAYDSGYDIVGDMASNSSLNSAVDIMGVHYPCGGDGASATSCVPSGTTVQAITAIGKPMWASEHGSQNYDTGALAMARAANRDYIDARITGMINWSLVNSWYRTLPYWGDGLMDADQPWSGSYDVGRSIWVMAHTTQFTQPGWQYLDSSVGYLSDNRANGSFVSLKSPNNSDYSVIFETVDAVAPQPVSFQVQGGLSTGTVHVWATNLNSQNSSDWFVQQSDISPNSGAFNLTLQPGYLYSLSTTTGQAKGSAAPPTFAVQSLPYSDNFESYPAGSLATYFDAIQGAFETAKCTGGHTGMCLRQVITQAPIAWGGASGTPPIVVVGDPYWTNYTVSTDAMLEQSGNIDLIGRLGMVSQSGNGGPSQGYHLSVTDSGPWTLFKEDASGNITKLASGTTTFGLNTWHNLSLSFQDSTIQAFIDSKSVATVTDTAYAGGNIAMLVGPAGSWLNAQFDNFSVTPGTGSNLVTIDDSWAGPAADEFNYVGSGWGHCSGGCGGDTTGLYDGSNSWDSKVNDYTTVLFSGTQFNFYGVQDTINGIGAVSIDGGAETDIDFYASARKGNVLLWTSPVLTEGMHTFKLRVTGMANTATNLNTNCPACVVVDRATIVP